MRDEGFWGTGTCDVYSSGSSGTIWSNRAMVAWSDQRLDRLMDSAMGIRLE